MSYQSPFHNSLGENPRLNPQLRGVRVPLNNAQADPIVESWTDPSRQSAGVQTQESCVASRSMNVNWAQPEYRLDVSSRGLAEPEDESGEGSDIETMAPGLVLKATTANLAAVLRLNSAMIYFSELVKTYISFDKICRGEMAGWKVQAAKHFDQLQRAINQIVEAYHGTRLRNRDNEGVLVNTARRIINSGKACKTTYLKEKAQDSTFLYAIAGKLEDWQRDGKKEIDMLKAVLASKWKQDSER